LLPDAVKGFGRNTRRTSMLKRFWEDETGLELSEYAVAAALVALAAVAAFQLLGTNIGAKINDLASKIQ
jgi:Flp pilus assembly pilin Flp